MPRLARRAVASGATVVLLFLTGACGTATRPVVGLSTSENIGTASKPTSGEASGRESTSSAISPLMTSSAWAQHNVQVLAGHSMLGRGYLGGGHLKASEFIASTFDSLGVLPIGQSYFQGFVLESDVFPTEPTLTIGSRSLRLGIDFLPWPGARSGSETRIEIVDASYGLYAPDQKLSDYSREDGGGDVKGKAVIVRKGLPDSLKSVLPPEIGWNEYKAAVAASLGAAMLLVRTESLLYGLSRDNATIPVFEIKDDTRIDPSESVTFVVESVPDSTFGTRNVIGLLPANTDNAEDSTIVITAHYDHLGPIGNAVYFPGANDNASGVALLLDLAQRYAHRPRSRDVVFIAFSGEETGLVGSNYFVEHPRIDLERVSLLVNLDMVASAEDGVVVMGGVEFPDVFKQLQQVGSALDKKKDDSTQHRIRPRAISPISDHFPFSQRGVKTLYLYTNMGLQPYHSIRDRAATLEWDDYLFVRSLVSGLLDPML